MPNNDMANQLRERENRRKSSIVANMIESPAEPSAPPEDKKRTSQNETDVKSKIDLVIPQKNEPRSRRKQIVLQPSVHERAEERCNELGISMNEAINQLLKTWLGME